MSLHVRRNCISVTQQPFRTHVRRELGLVIRLLAFNGFVSAPVICIHSCRSTRGSRTDEALFDTRSRIAGWLNGTSDIRAYTCMAMFSRPGDLLNFRPRARSFRCGYVLQRGRLVNVHLPCAIKGQSSWVSNQVGEQLQQEIRRASLEHGFQAPWDKTLHRLYTKFLVVVDELLPLH